MEIEPEENSGAGGGNPQHPLPHPVIEHPRRCEYLVQGEGPQHECGEPATQRINSARTLYYCDTHADFVRDNYRRMGKRIDLVPIRKD